jgi:hypothetical protein
LVSRVTTSLLLFAASIATPILWSKDQYLPTDWSARAACVTDILAAVSYAHSSSTDETDRPDCCCHTGVLPMCPLIPTSSFIPASHHFVGRFESAYGIPRWIHHDIEMSRSLASSSCRPLPGSAILDSNIPQERCSSTSRRHCRSDLSIQRSMAPATSASRMEKAVGYGRPRRD